MRQLFSILVSAIIILFAITPAHAARYFAVSETSEFRSEGFFEIDVLLDTQSETINAVEGDLALPGDLVSIVDIRTGGSFVSFWVEPPHQTSTSSVHFAGIFPGGYSGSTAYLFTVIGQVKNAASRSTSSSPFLGNVAMQNISVLLNDGLGTPTDTNFTPFQVSISQAAAATPDNDNRQILQANDEDPPELFQPIVTQDKNLHDGQLTLIFSTQDKGVGVSHYEVFESDEQITDDDPARVIHDWKRVESPYVLQDQTRSKFIYVKAVDKVGNERVVLVPAQHPLGSYSNKAIWGIIVSVIIVLVVLALVLWHHQLPKKEATYSQEIKENNKE